MKKKFGDTELVCGVNVMKLDPAAVLKISIALASFLSAYHCRCFTVPQKIVWKNI